MGPGLGPEGLQLPRPKDPLCTGPRGRVGTVPLLLPSGLRFPKGESKLPREKPQGAHKHGARPREAVDLDPWVLGAN